MNRRNLKKDSSENEKSEKGQFWKRKLDGQQARHCGQQAGHCGQHVGHCGQHCPNHHLGGGGQDDPRIYPAVLGSE